MGSPHEPTILVNPYSDKYEERQAVAHYLLLAALILDDTVVGYPENARMLMVYLHEALGVIFSKLKKRIFLKKK